ncbi:MULTISPECIES: DUF2922 family protein [Enterococcus]|uniref:DUF2922 family protein n=1 Tax=Enterococcus malodoratus ATCC 43197 TaxID=1158601 RepID=R2RGZ5_9ENTE|nr:MULTISPECIES: DUF2922 family protein [Enterococcus]EOH75284.1 hypothetical protein UAI_03086 [Enterococcus malodoratus ATCC 43197]EOT66746.1 hypothetical protein I585_02267 [Enterococcus malodoratus ATCC 43197]OJG65958.1 hypothetical protein RV07_GL001545 [Enterococcus malodoratus]SPW90768.1 Uncharacterised protein [Enterococcus malodoratus]STD70001.1 Uncharacterised protein [Enterococcus malodoratus]
MKKIVSIFKTSAGRSQTWSYADPGEGKSTEEIRGILERFTLLHLFEKDDEKLFNEVVSAKYVETVETIIF